MSKILLFLAVFGGVATVGIASDFYRGGFTQEESKIVIVGWLIVAAVCGAIPIAIPLPWLVALLASIAQSTGRTIAHYGVTMKRKNQTRKALNDYKKGVSPTAWS